MMNPVSAELTLAGAMMIAAVLAEAISTHKAQTRLVSARDAADAEAGQIRGNSSKSIRYHPETPRD
jgi:hypothetical protein